MRIGDTQDTIANGDTVPGENAGEALHHPFRYAP
jgi:hypothetical protein